MLAQSCKAGAAPSVTTRPRYEQRELVRAGPAAALAGPRLPSAPAPAPSSALNGCKQKAELLFVHTADEAELTAAADGALTLVLRNVSRFRSGGRARCTPRRSTPTSPSSRAGTPATRGWAGPMLPCTA